MERRDDRLERSSRMESDGDLAPAPRRRREQPEQMQQTLGALIDDLEAIVERGSRIPFSSKVLVDRDIYLDALDAVRTAMPEAVMLADRIVRDKERIITQAEAEAERIMSLAREQVAFLISERQLLRTAEVQSNAILSSAKEEAKEIVSSAQKYAGDLLAQLENETLRILSEVRKTSSQVR